MSAHPFGRPAPGRSDLPALADVVTAELNSIPPRREEPIDFAHGRALDRLRVRLVGMGATIAFEDGMWVAALGGVSGKGKRLDEALHAWLDAAPRNDVVAFADRQNDRSAS